MVYLEMMLMDVESHEVTPVVKAMKIVSINSLSARPKLVNVAKRTQDHLLNDVFMGSLISGIK